MNGAKHSLSAAIIGAALLATGAAQANTTWAWSYTAGGINASGTFATAGNANAREDILSITGQRNGVPILGLVPLGDPVGSNWFTWDKQFLNAFPYFTYDGLLFDLGGGVNGYVNVFGDSIGGGGYGNFEFGANVGWAFEPINFTATQVPEAPTLGCMALGLAALGVLMQSRRRTA